MKHLRAWLLIAAYTILVGIVVVGAFWINNEFDDNHDTQCSIAKAQIEIAGAFLTEPLPADPNARRLLNDAIDKLNDTCGFNLDHV